MEITEVRVMVIEVVKIITTALVTKTHRSTLTKIRVEIITSTNNLLDLLLVNKCVLSLILCLACL